MSNDPVTDVSRPIAIEPASGATKRVLLLTHRAPEQTSAALATVLSILEECDVEVLVPPAEVVKHERLAAYTTSEGVTLRPGGEDLIIVLGGSKTETKQDDKIVKIDPGDLKKILPPGGEIVIPGGEKPPFEEKKGPPEKKPIDPPIVPVGPAPASIDPEMVRG